MKAPFIGMIVAGIALVGLQFAAAAGKPAVKPAAPAASPAPVAAPTPAPVKAVLPPAAKTFLTLNSNPIAAGNVLSVVTSSGTQVLCGTRYNNYEVIDSSRSYIIAVTSSTSLSGSITVQSVSTATCSGYSSDTYK